MFLKFQNKLHEQIAEISALPGTIRIPEFTLPSKFSKICFFELGKTCSLPSDLQKDEAMVCDAVSSDVANVFLFPLQENDMKIPKIAVAESPLCVNIPAGIFRLKITGQGKSALLEEA